MTLILATLVFILGTAIGSFLSVVIYRLRQNKKGIFLSRSVCSKCETPLKATHLIPLLSFLFLKGRCAFCGTKISINYFLLEIITGLLFLITFLEFNFLLVIPSGIDPSYFSYAIDWFLFEKFLFYLVILSFLTAIFFYDLLYLEIPDKLSLPLIAVAIAGGLVLKTPEIPEMLTGGLVFFLFFAIQYYLSRGKWIGAGDMRMGIIIGVLLGLKMGLLALIAAYVLGAFVSVILMLKKKITKKSILPFAPFLVSGIIIALFAGKEILHWYLAFIVI